MTPGQLSFPARADDPDTSHEAARDDYSTNRARCLQAVRDLGDATRDEIAEHTGLPANGWTSKRLSELRDQGFIEASGVRRRGVCTGKSQTVWRMA